jgi:hypothetical protein
MKEEWMERQDEHFADSGLPIEERSFTRRAALKVGGLSLAGAALAWALPGRAKADITCTYNTGCYDNTQCNSGGTGFGCRCQKIYWGHIQRAGAPKYGCVADGFCDDFAPCPRGQNQCPAATLCVADTCCAGYGYGPVCLPLCTPPGVGGAPTRPTNKHGMTSMGRV